MPPLSVWFIRTALLALTAGTSLGSVLLAVKGMPGRGPPSGALPLHIELLLIGWLVNLTLGVAYWILPKHARGRERGHPVPPWAAYLLLNAGVVIAGSAAPAGLPALLLAGRAAELSGVACFAAHAWSRVKPFGAGR